MKSFECITARDAEHAVELLAQYAPDARLIAGGTDLIVDIKAARATPAVVIDISHARDLKRLELTDDVLVIGSMVTHGEMAQSQLVRELCPALAVAAHSIGAVQTRNLGTIGGNLANAVPSMDIGPALLALDATVSIARQGALRRSPLGGLFAGPRRTTLAPDELILDVTVPATSFRKPMAFLKFGLRKGQALSLVNVAAGFWSVKSAPVFRDTRIALGAVAPTIIRAADAERYLDGREVGAMPMEEAGRIAAAEASPISDFRASAEYRRELISVLTGRALQSAWRRAQPEPRRKTA